MTEEKILDHPEKYDAIVIGTEDFKEGTTAFLERRKPNFK